MKIRKAREEDCEALTSLFLKLTSYLKSITKKKIVSTLSNKTRELLKSNQLKGAKITFVAGEKKKISGFLMGYILDMSLYKIAVIDDIYVLKEQQKKGIGKKLVKSFIKECKKRGIKTIFTITPKKNETAKEFFQHIGFKKLPSVHFYLKL